MIVGVGIAIGGSVSLNEIGNTTEALVTSSTLETSGIVSVIATDNSTIWADAGAGALAIGVGKGATVAGAVGISVAENRIGEVNVAGVDRDHLTRAEVDDSDVGSIAEPVAQLIVRGDAGGRFQNVAEVLNACKQADVRELGIAVRPTAPER